MDQKELRQQEDRCIQEQAPACTAACPLHVDARSLLSEIKKGDFAAAFKIYHKTVPFPAIISRICDQPCKKACLRKDLGGAIEIAAMERACQEYGSQTAEPIRPLPRKPKTVAIIGAGVSSLTAAWDLARKGWGVLILEASGRIGGGLWQIPPDRLPPGVITAELEGVTLLGVEIRLNSPVEFNGGNGDALSLATLCGEYDAVFLGIGPSPGIIDGLDMDSSGCPVIDPFTFQCGPGKVFAGGDVLRPPAEDPGAVHPPSAILSMSEGRRAATSIDRFLQNVSLTAGRVNEGSYPTRLFTNTTGIASQPPALQENPYGAPSREVAAAESARCIECQCLECVKVCEYLAHYKAYPRKYVREIYNNLSIVMGTRLSNQFINSCSLCGLCAEVCPTDFDMGAICHDARQLMVEQKRMPPSAHDFALRDMAFSNGEKFDLARNPPGEKHSAYAFFPGCQLAGWSPEYVQKAYAFLVEAFPGEPVGLILRCCGALADWAGRKDIFEGSQTEFRSRYAAMGKPKLILACSSCYRVFQDHYPDVEILSFWDVFDRLGPRQLPARPLMEPLAVHDPCSTRYEGHIQDSVRSILHKAGCQVQELPLSREKTECCSYGGEMWLANRPLAEDVVRRRIAESPLDYLTYCAMCRDFFARRGKRTTHLFDIIFGEPSQDHALHPALFYSQRQENRARLKETYLTELWSETMPEKAAHESIRLVFSQEVRQQIEDRLILEEDIRKVLAFALETGKRMFNPASGHYLASYQPASVTYWVEYTPQEDAFAVHKAYSHRMEIGLGAEK